MLTVAGLIGSAVVARARPVVPLGVALSLLKPIWASAAVALALVALRPDQTEVEESESAYLHAVAMELRAGASLRSALVAGADRAPDLPLVRVCRLATMGAPIEMLADSLRVSLRLHGRVAAAALQTAGQTGGQVAVVFENLAQVASEDRQQRRETRTATAQARISAWIVGGLPAGYVVFLGVSGRMADLLASPIGAGIVVVGVAFLAAGAAAVAIMMRAALS